MFKAPLCCFFSESTEFLKKWIFWWVKIDPATVLVPKEWKRDWIKKNDAGSMAELRSLVRVEPFFNCALTLSVWCNWMFYASMEVVDLLSPNRSELNWFNIQGKRWYWWLKKVFLVMGLSRLLLMLELGWKIDFRADLYQIDEEIQSSIIFAIKCQISIIQDNLLLGCGKVTK